MVDLTVLPFLIVLICLAEYVLSLARGRKEEMQLGSAGRGGEGPGGRFLVVVAVLRRRVVIAPALHRRLLRKDEIVVNLIEQD